MCAVFAWWGHRAMIRDRLARRSRRGLRRHFLPTDAGAGLPPAIPAHAQDAPWSTAPGSSDFNTAANWTPPAVPTGTAFFGASNITSLSFSANTTVGGFTFNPGAPAYAFTVPSPFSL